MLRGFSPFLWRTELQPSRAACKGSEFISDQIQFEVGDVLVACTDGITEAENVQGGLWGYRRLENLLRTCHDDKPEKIIRCILDEVAAFAGGGSQRDDFTLIAIRVQEDAN